MVSFISSPRNSKQVLDAPRLLRHGGLSEYQRNYHADYAQNQAGNEHWNETSARTGILGFYLYFNSFGLFLVHNCLSFRIRMVVESRLLVIFQRAMTGYRVLQPRFL